MANKEFLTDKHMDDMLDKSGRLKGLPKKDAGLESSQELGVHSGVDNDLIDPEILEDEQQVLKKDPEKKFIPIEDIEDIEDKNIEDLEEVEKDEKEKEKKEKIKLAQRMLDFLSNKKNIDNLKDFNLLKELKKNPKRIASYGEKHSLEEILESLGQDLKKHGITMSTLEELGSLSEEKKEKLKQGLQEFIKGSIDIQQEEEEAAA